MGLVRNESNCSSSCKCMAMIKYEQQMKNDIATNYTMNTHTDTDTDTNGRWCARSCTSTCVCKHVCECDVANKKEIHEMDKNIYWMIWCMAMVIWPLSLPLFFLLLLLWMSQQCARVCVQTSCNDAVLRTKAAKQIYILTQTRNNNNKKEYKINESLSFRTDYAQQESESLWITFIHIHCSGERWAMSESTFCRNSDVGDRRMRVRDRASASARQSESCIQVHIYNKNVQWVSGCC